MHYIFLGVGKAKQVFKALAMAAIADRLLEMKFGKRIVAGTPERN